MKRLVTLNVVLTLTCVLLLNAQHWSRVDDLPSNGGFVTTIVQLKTGAVTAVLMDGRFLRSTDEGRSWLVVHQRLGPGTISYFKKDDLNNLYCGITNGQGRSVEPTKYFVSNDEGVNWRELYIDLPGYKNQVPFEIFVLEHSGTLVCSSMGEIYISQDKGESWKSLDMKKQGQSYLHIIDFPQSDRIWVMNFRDNGVYTISLTGEMKQVGELHGRSSEAQMTPTVLSRIISINDSLIVGTSNNEPYLFCSTNAGVKWDSLNSTVELKSRKSMPASVWRDGADQLGVYSRAGSCYSLKLGGATQEAVEIPSGKTRFFRVEQLKSGALLGLGAGEISRWDPNSHQWTNAALPGLTKLVWLERLGNTLLTGSDMSVYASSVDALSFHPYQTQIPTTIRSHVYCKDSVAFIPFGKTFAYSSDEGNSWVTRSYFPDNRVVYNHLVSIDHQTICMIGRFMDTLTKSPELEERLLYSSDAGLHWTEMEAFKRKGFVGIGSVAIYNDQVVVESMFDGLFQVQAGSKNVAQFNPINDQSLQEFPEVHTRHTHSNPAFLRNGDLMFMLDSVLYLSKTGENSWAEARIQPPSNKWTWIQRILLRRNEKTAELLVLTDPNNRICVSVAGSQWKELELDSNAKRDRYLHFTIGNFSDNSIQLIANSESDGLWSTTVNGLRLFDTEIMQASVEVHPNPVDHQLSISLPDPIDHILKLRVVSLDGKEQQLISPQIRDNTAQLDCSAFAPGTYLLEVQCADGVRRAQFVVQR